MQQALPLRTLDWRWACIAMLTGLLLIGLPPTSSILVIGFVGLTIICVIEPAIAIMVMLAVSPLKTLIETEVAFPFPVDIGQLSFLFAVGVWTTYKIAHRQKFLSPTTMPLFFPLMIFIITTALTLPNAYSVSAGLKEWLRWLEILALVYITVDFPKNRWQWLLFGLILAGVIQALIGIYEFNGGSGAAHLWILDFRFFRAFGTFGQPNPFGAFMGLMLPLAIGTAWGHLTKTWAEYRESQNLWTTTTMLTIMYGLMAGILLIGLLVSWSRGSWMGFSIASLVMIWLLPRRFWQGTVLLALVSVIGWLLWLNGYLPAQLVDRVTSFSADFTGFSDVRGVDINDDNFALIERLAHWQSAIEIAEENPWLGVGFGNYEVAYPDFALVNWPLALGHAHNYYLNLIAETGILGLLAYLLMWAFIIYKTWQLIRRTHYIERGIALGLMGVWVHIAIHSLVDKLYVNNSFLHIGVMFGLIAVLQLQRSKFKSLRMLCKAVI